MWDATVFFAALRMTAVVEVFAAAGFFPYAMLNVRTTAVNIKLAQVSLSGRRPGLYQPWAQPKVASGGERGLKARSIDIRIRMEWRG